MKLNPHNHLTRLGKPPHDHWRCEYCGDHGSMDEITSRACSHVYPPCPHCGETPECAPNCSGIAAALGTAGIYLAGFGTGTKH